MALAVFVLPIALAGRLAFPVFTKLYTPRNTMNKLKKLIAVLWYLPSWYIALATALIFIVATAGLFIPVANIVGKLTMDHFCNEADSAPSFIWAMTRDLFGFTWAEETLWL